MEIDHVLIRVADLDAASHALDAEHGLSTVGSYRSTIVHARGVFGGQPVPSEVCGKSV
jgi:hypothetical protein